MNFLILLKIEQMIFMIPDFSVSDSLKAGKQYGEKIYDFAIKFYDISTLFFVKLIAWFSY